MKKIFSIAVISFLFSICHGQRLAQITLTNSGTADIITFITNDAILINITKDGKIIDWGIESTRMRYNNYPGKLDQYMGRVEYYPADGNEDLKGKVRYIGITAVTYFLASEGEQFKGKVKSIGSVFFDYYDAYNDAALKGKIKNAGTYPFNYYTTFDNEAYRGKLKIAGTSVFTYYDSFEDKAYKGKIKSIDSQRFTYYSSFDRQEYRGTMKGGNQMQYMISGIKYLLRN